jgi:UDP-N-acetylmuramoyl-tripeptide--D-alanyl-D-alanine ligase
MPSAARRVVHDSRAVRPGDLYVALRGERWDGHAFVDDAFARGAVGAVVARGAPGGGGARLVVDDPRRALSRLAHAHRARLRGRVVVVTGSVGKSSVKEMIASVLERAGRVCRNPGNWNNDLGVPLSLLAMEPDDDWGVFEIGMNHPGELAPLCRLLQPAWGVMTRIGPVHLEFFEDEAAIADEKATLFRFLPEDGLAVAAADEPWFERVAMQSPAPVRSLAIAAGADYEGWYDAGARTLTVQESDGARARYRLPLPGEHVARNALRAVAVGREAGVPPEEIAEGLIRFRPPPMRWCEQEADGVRWINDAYNASPLSMAAALRTFAELEIPGGKWVVLGGMRELGARSPDLHRDVGRQAAAQDWAGLFCVGPLGAAIAEGAVQAGFDPRRLFPCRDAADAAGILADRARPGDAVLLKGSRGECMEEVLNQWMARRSAPSVKKNAGPAGNEDPCFTN